MISIQQVPDETVPAEFELTEEFICNSLEFDEVTSVGGLFESVESENAASYFSGYLLMKVNVKHKRIDNKAISNCNECSKLLSKPNFDFHLFNSFKEYKDNCNSLFYCSSEFLKCVTEFERVFLYCFKNIGHISGFNRTVSSILMNHCRQFQLVHMCNHDLKSYLVNFFVKCRTYQSIKVFNRYIVSQNQRDKFKKITHQ